jgi:hypothetical protein
MHSGCQFLAVQTAISCNELNKLIKSITTALLQAKVDASFVILVHVVKSVEEMQNLYLALSGRLILAAQQLIHFTQTSKGNGG